MFYSCSSLIDLNLFNWNIFNVSDVTYILSGCTNLKTIKFGNNITINNYIGLD